MLRAIYIFMLLALLILTRCTTVESSPTALTMDPRELLLSREDMPTGWKSSEILSDEYDDLCYTDCAMIQFFLAEEDKASSEQSIYVYDTIDEAERNYKQQLIPLQLGTTPSDWSYQSDIAVQSNFACYTHRDASFPSCSWTAQYGRYLVFFVASLLPDKMSLDDLQNVIDRIDSRMEAVAHESQ